MWSPTSVLDAGNRNPAPSMAGKDGPMRTGAAMGAHAGYGSGRRTSERISPAVGVGRSVKKWGVFGQQRTWITTLRLAGQVTRDSGLDRSMLYAVTAIVRRRGRNGDEYAHGHAAYARRVGYEQSL